MAEPTKNQVVVGLVAILALGAFLRLHHLGTTSLVIDEITYVSDSDPSKSFRETWRHLFASYPTFHRPPFPVVLQLGCMKVAQVLRLPMNEFMYRTPSALMGVGSVLVMFLLGRRLFGETAGLAGAFLLSISFFHVYHSREVYMYSPYFFFALLSWWFFANAAMDLWEGKPTRLGDVIGYSVATALTLQMHMAATFFGGAQLLVFLIVVSTRSDQPKRFIPFLCAHILAWVTISPTVLHFVRHYRSDDEKLAQIVSATSFLRMFGEMGWSSQMLPLILFLGLVGTGVWMGFRDGESRKQSLLCLLLGGMAMAGVVFASRKARFESRYFQLVQPTLLLFAAVAWVSIDGTVRSKVSARRRALVWVLPCLVLLGWSAPFYHQLFQLKGKLIAGRALAEWINTNTPEGSVYFFDYPWARLDVPTMYPTPNRVAMCVSPPIHEAYGDPDRSRKLIEFTRDTIRRFPDFFYVNTQHARLEGAARDSNAWCREFFRRQARIENPSLPRLFDMGMLPSAAFYPQRKGYLKDGLVTDMYEPTDIFYNTKDDLIEISRASGHQALAMFGKGWMCSLLNDGTIWRGLQREGTIVVHGVQEAATTSQITLVCANFGDAQSILVTIDGKETSCDLPSKLLSRVSLGSVNLHAGKAEIAVRRLKPQTEDQFPDVLAYELVTVP